MWHGTLFCHGRANQNKTSLFRTFIHQLTESFRVGYGVLLSERPKGGQFRPLQRDFDVAFY